MAHSAENKRIRDFYSPQNQTMSRSFLRNFIALRSHLPASVAAAAAAVDVIVVHYR